MSSQMQSITVTMNEKPKELKATRMAFDNRMKILEAVTDADETFYLFFYKEHFLLAKELKRKENSQLSRCFQNGIVLTAPHPLIQTYVDEHKTFPLKTVKLTFRNMMKQYSPQEVSLILSYFDTFIPKEKITDIFKKFFIDYRRNGQFNHAYQILMVLLSFDKENKWGLDMANQIHFQKYKLLYEVKGKELFEKDPLYGEMLLFGKRKEQASFSKLQSLHASKGRWVDQLVLYIDHFKKGSMKEEAYYDSFLKLLSAHYSSEERALLLWESYKGAVKDTRLLQELLEAFLNQARYEEAINVLCEQTPEDLSSLQKKQLAELLQKPSLDYESINLENLQSFLINENSMENLEKILRSVIPTLLGIRELAAVHLWLKPIITKHKKLPILKIFQTMMDYQDDPEQQFSLGKLYHQFKLYNQAIECFSWEMELRPDDPDPVQWMMKTYKELGMIEESKSYMSLYTSMQKASR
ncbi:tetratricopeptide repeat protein [Metabacillus sp. RGM 3146]|uniref:tetratricopeptide repeat protein n=1 Tax=Metabacillus sp. RGM 3146 TaxID=3401092 RepID=UPI003B9BBE79